MIFVISVASKIFLQNWWSEQLKSLETAKPVDYIHMVQTSMVARRPIRHSGRPIMSCREKRPLIFLIS